MASKLGLAIKIASEAFMEKTDRGGQPYILHCLFVMNEVSYLGHEAMIVAVLHDLLEDTNWTEEKLLVEGFDKSTIEMIKMITHLDDEDYMDYVARTALNKTTRRIKMADLCHNSDIHRMKGLRDKDFKRLEKYFKAYAYLKEKDKD